MTLSDLQHQLAAMPEHLRHPLTDTNVELVSSTGSTLTFKTCDRALLSEISDLRDELCEARSEIGRHERDVERLSSELTEARANLKVAKAEIAQLKSQSTP